MFNRFSRQLLKSSQPTFSQVAQHFSIYQSVKPAPPDPILGIAEAFKKSTDPRKVNLGIGAYRDDNGKPVVLECVKKAQEFIVKKNLDNEYSPVQGIDSFLNASLKLAYGSDFAAVKEQRIAAMQSLSGTGALRLGWDFCKKFLPAGTMIYMPDYTWPNHKGIADEIKLQTQTYQYFDVKTNGLNFTGLVNDLSKAKEGSIVLMHACSHNPTGVDPNVEQWKKMRDIVEQRKLIAFFDMAYQGFTSGDIEKDSFAVRYFSQKSSIPIILTQSFAKNFGLYGQRVGCLSMICNSKTEAETLQSQLKIIARRTYSNPPLHGARIVDIVLNDKELYALWLKEVKQMADRIASMRKDFVKYINKAGTKKNWDHITNQIGMFAYTGINPQQVEKIEKDFQIFMAKDGRISMAGLNTKNVEYVANAFHSVTK